MSFSGESCGKEATDQKPSAASDESESPSDGLRPQDDETALTHNSPPQTPERPAPSAPGAAGIGTVSGQEDEEEVEVDVVLYSPEKRPPPREYEGGLDNMVITPDEEEEDDMSDIDVTGD